MLAKNEIRIPLFDLVNSLSDIIDLVNPALVGHHKRVAYIAYSLATEMGMSRRECADLLLAGMLHDIGALSLEEKMRALQFEIVAPHRHAEMGGLLLKSFDPLAEIGNLVRFHHVKWCDGAGQTHGGENVPVCSHILHLADRVAVLLRKQSNTFDQAKSVCRKIKSLSGGMFMPEAVDAFINLSGKYYFWLDVTSHSLGSLLRRRARLETIDLGLEGIASLARVFSQVIDFRSTYTATHSSGVAAIAQALAQLIGFSENECRMMKVAGYLHDLGKLAIPQHILEKNSPLTRRETNMIRCHPFYSYRALEHIDDFRTINIWSAFHHESPNGGGYPFHVPDHELPLGSRIVAVADVFTAITEHRPYRLGMEGDRALGVLQNMACNGELDARVVALMVENFATMNSLREAVQSDLSCAYATVQSQLSECAP